MVVKNLYRYKDGNCVVVSPVSRSKDDEASGYRLIADEGKTLFSNGIETFCIDVDINKASEWTERQIDNNHT